MQETLLMDNDVKKLLHLIYAPMYTRVIFAGLELDLFLHLEEELHYVALAEKLGLHAINTGHLLDALTAMELLKKTGKCFQNNLISQKYLNKNSAFFIGDHLRLYQMATGFEGLDIVRCLKEGPVDGYEEKKGLDAYAMFDEWMEMIKNGQRGGREREIVKVVTALPEFSRFKKMLDLGGGPGLLGMAVVKAHPVLKGVIFDAPNVRGMAEKSITESGLAGRVEFLSGDYNTDSIGEQYDFILAVGTLNFAKHALDKVVRKIYDVLNPNGVFMCISEGLTDEKTRPAEMVVSWLPSLLKGCDFRLVQGEISDAALRNGFKSVYKRTVNMLVGEMDLDIARK